MYRSRNTPQHCSTTSHLTEVHPAQSIHHAHRSIPRVVDSWIRGRSGLIVHSKWQNETESWGILGGPTNLYFWWVVSRVWRIPFYGEKIFQNMGAIYVGLRYKCGEIMKPTYRLFLTLLSFFLKFCVCRRHSFIFGGIWFISGGTILTPWLDDGRIRPNKMGRKQHYLKNIMQKL